jgi:tetratricopeptide (TPR) repeat protein
MNTFTHRDYDLGDKYQARQQASAKRNQLARIASDNGSWRDNVPVFVGRQPLMTVFTLLILIIFVTPLAAVSAGESVHSPLPSDDIDAGVIGSGLLAYRLGNYYYVTGDYERAAEYFTEAIAQTPERVFGLAPQMSVFHWGLFDAQIALEQYEQAAATYTAYIAVAGTKADQYFADYVQDIADSLGIMFLIGDAWA